MKHLRKFVMAALMFCLAVVGVLLHTSSVKAAQTGTVYVSVERFSLGQGYLVEPTAVTFTEGENYAQIFDRLMKNNGYRYQYKGTLTDGFYLESIYNADTGKLNIPQCIMNMEPSMGSNGGEPENPPTNENNLGNPDYPNLGEFAYTSQSGWYYHVNSVAPNVGFSGTKAKDGDVVRFQFTVFGLGKDLGDNGYPGALKYPNRDAVTKKMAIMRTYPKSFNNTAWKNAYNQAVSVVSNLDSTQAQVTAVTNALPDANQINTWITAQKNQAEEQANIKKYTPSKTKLKSAKKQSAKSVRLTWKKVKGCTGYEVYMSKKKNSGYKKIATLKKAKKVTYTKKKLKKKKTYYFKVRTYKTVNGKKYYSTFSNVKKVKMK